MLSAAAVVSVSLVLEGDCYSLSSRCSSDTNLSKHTHNMDKIFSHRIIQKCIASKDVVILPAASTFRCTSLPSTSSVRPAKTSAQSTHSTYANTTNARRHFTYSNPALGLCTRPEHYTTTMSPSNRLTSVHNVQCASKCLLRVPLSVHHLTLER